MENEETSQAAEAMETDDQASESQASGSNQNPPIANQKKPYSLEVRIPYTLHTDPHRDFLFEQYKKFVDEKNQKVNFHREDWSPAFQETKLSFGQVKIWFKRTLKERLEAEKRRQSKPEERKPEESICSSSSSSSTEDSSLSTWAVSSGSDLRRAGTSGGDENYKIVVKDKECMPLSQRVAIESSQPQDGSVALDGDHYITTVDHRTGVYTITKKSCTVTFDGQQKRNPDVTKKFWLDVHSNSRKIVVYRDSPPSSRGASKPSTEPSSREQDTPQIRQQDTLQDRAQATLNIREQDTLQVTKQNTVTEKASQTNLQYVPPAESEVLDTNTTYTDEYIRVPEGVNGHPMLANAYPECDFNFDDYELFGWLKNLVRRENKKMVSIHCDGDLFFHALSVALRMQTNDPIPDGRGMRCDLEEYMRSIRGILVTSVLFDSYERFYIWRDRFTRRLAPACLVVMQAACDCWHLSLLLRQESGDRRLTPINLRDDEPVRFTLELGRRGHAAYVVIFPRDIELYNKQAVPSDDERCKEIRERNAREIAERYPQHMQHEMNAARVTFSYFPECNFNYGGEIFNTLSNIAKDNNMVLVDVEGDGTCFFHAVSVALRHQGWSCSPGYRLKMEVLEFMRTSDEFWNSIEFAWVPETNNQEVIDVEGSEKRECHKRYLNGVARGEHWADSYDILGTHKYLDVDIDIYALKEEGADGHRSQFKDENGRKGKTTITLANIDNRHYAVMLQRRG